MPSRGRVSRAEDREPEAMTKQTASDSRRAASAAAAEQRRIARHSLEEWLARDDSGKDVLYGDVSRQSDQVRTQVGEAVAQSVRAMLKAVYPNATQAELDEAAYKALTTQGGQNVQVMWYGKLKDKDGTIGPEGYNVQSNPVDIARRISSFMPQPNPDAAAYFDAAQTKLLPEIKKWEKGIDNYDTSTSGVTGLLNDIGPIGQIALSFIPGMAPVIAAANAVAGVEQGDIGKAAVSAVSAYAGFTGTNPVAAVGDKMGGMIGDALNVTDTAVQSAINAGSSAAITNATGTLLSGGDFGDAIKAGIIGGVAAGAGSYVKGVVNEAVDGQPANYGQDGGNTPDNAESYLHDKPLDNWYDQQTVDADGTFYNPPLDSFEGSDGGLISIAKPDTSVLQPVANTVSGAAGGATSGLINAVGTGKDISDSILVGAATGAANGAVKDLGGSDTTAAGVGGVTNILVSDAVKDDPKPTPGNSGSTPAPEKAKGRPFGAVTDDMFGFGAVLPMFRDLTQNRKTDWTKRKFGG